MSDEIERVYAKLAELNRKLHDLNQVGTVHEVKGTKLRMSLGKDKNGQDILTPWLNTNDMRGGAREQRFYKKGQTLALVAPGGDITQAMITPYAPNQNFRTPEHATEANGQENEESFQLADYRGKETQNGHDYWLQPEQQQSGQQQGGQQGGGQQQQRGHVGGQSASVKARMHGTTGHTHRYGTDSRMAAGKDGAKLRMLDDFVSVVKGKIVMSQPPIIEDKDPIKNDDA